MRLRLYHLPSFCFLVVFLSRRSNQVTGSLKDYFNHKRRLVEHLTENSTVIREILPATDINTAVNVKLRVSLRQISKVDEKNQAIRLTVWLTFYWNNPFLTWDPKEYGGIRNVHVNNEFFWLPDAALFNEASLEEEIDILYKRLGTKLIIHSSGECQWQSPATLLSQCRIDVARFPFDEQTCNITIGSWTYSGRKINITYYKEDVEMNHFIQNGAWKVQKAVLVNDVKLYGTDERPYPEVIFNLQIKRLSLYYRLNIVIPCALISLLALFSFIVPSDHGERMSLVITVLLSLSVYMLIVSSSLPETSDAVPILGAYCLSIIVTIALCLCATCLTLNFRASTGDMPRWLEVVIFRVLARFVFVDGENERTSREISNEHKVSISLNHEKFTRISDDGTVELNANDVARNKFEDSLLEEVRFLTEELRSKLEEESFLIKWKKAAKVVDRFSLLLFSVIYGCLIAYLLSYM